MTTFMQWIVPTPQAGRSSPAPTRGVAQRSPTRCRNNDPVATASATQTPPRSPASRPNLVSVGTIDCLSSELMLFAALFAIYFTHAYSIVIGSKHITLNDTGGGFLTASKQVRHGATSKSRSNTASNSTKHKSPHLSGWRQIISLIT